MLPPTTLQKVTPLHAAGLTEGDEPLDLASSLNNGENLCSYGPRFKARPMADPPLHSTLPLRAIDDGIHCSGITHMVHQGVVFSRFLWGLVPAPFARSSSPTDCSRSRESWIKQTSAVGPDQDLYTRASAVVAARRAPWTLRQSHRPLRRMRVGTISGWRIPVNAVDFNGLGFDPLPCSPYFTWTHRAL